MKRYLLMIVLVLIGLSQSAYGQDFKSDFNSLFDKNDFPGQEKLLKKWEKAKPNDPELFVSYFNYFFRKSRNETLSLSKNPRSKDSIAVKKENDENPVAYFGTNVSFNKEDFDKGILHITKGIEKFPNRLDMRFGKVYVFGQIEDYKSFTKGIVEAVEYSKVNKNKWSWTDGKPLDDPEMFMLRAVQDYVIQLFNAGDEVAGNIKTIAETVLRYYPDNVENLSNLAVYHMLVGDFDSALVPLVKAEKIAPTDFIVLSNIAFCYLSKGDKTNAVKYYELVIIHGDGDAKAQAREKLAELANKN